MLDKITVRASFDARPDDVFMALTDAALMTRWSGEGAAMERKVGGQFEMFDGWVRGRVLEFKPPRLLSYSWRAENWPEEEGESIVRFTIARDGGATSVMIEHWGFPDENEMKTHEDGWRKYFVEPLTTYFEERKTERRSRASAAKKSGPVKKAPVKKGVKKG